MEIESRTATAPNDFGEFLWMGDEDVEIFEREYERQLLDEEILWLEFEQMLAEEEIEQTVYYCGEVEDDEQGAEPVSTDQPGSSLNPAAPCFVPSDSAFATA